jgi:S1-C subfamily serine protease
MKFSFAAAVLLIFGVPAALAQNSTALPSHLPTAMEERGASLGKMLPSSIANFQSSQLRQIESDIPTAQLSKIARQSFSEVGARTRSAKDAEIYRAASPSVVKILTTDGLGSGSLIGASGEIITSYHVVRGHSDVAVVFKPTIEGREPTRDDMKLGHVVKFDEVADLALVKSVEVPKGRNPIRLGDSSEMAVGADAHAIGHPTGEAWTYTKGVISQFRIGFEWTVEKVKHKADLIQTQTPINPGNSGGPLISDSGNLIGVNTFKSEGEGLNFAVSADDVRRFLVRQGDRLVQGGTPSPKKTDCEPKEISKSRNKANDASVIEYDIYCNGKVNADYVIPDKQSEAIMFMVDRKGYGRPDIIYFDLNRQGKWDLSFWDENFDGHWTLVGYHPDGSLTPSRFESYDAFQKRLAKG